jgi:hypothetical protein
MSNAVAACKRCQGKIIHSPGPGAYRLYQGGSRSRAGSNSRAG